MVDRIRMFNSDFKGMLKLENLEPFRPKDAEWGFKYYKLKSLIDKKESIYLTIKVGAKDGKQFISIDGSLRKWMFGMNGFQDLDYCGFKRAIEIVEKQLCLETDALWDFKVSILEVGFNVQLPMAFKGMVDCYGSYSTFRRIWYERETMCFEGDSYSMIVYDKGEEIVKKREVRNSKKDAKSIKKLITRATWLRYEFKTDKLSKVPSMAKLGDTPGKILNNWGEILDKVHGNIKKMKFINHSLPSYTSEFVGKNKTEFKNYLINVAMLSIGVGKTMAMADKLKRNSETLKIELQALNRTFVDKPRLDLERDLRRTISRRVRKLKRNDEPL